MAVIDYKMVYRDGAASGAPVLNFRLADTEAELGSGSEGDIAYAKDTDKMYIYTGSIWLAQFGPGGGVLTGDLTIQKTRPNIILDPSGNYKLRVFSAIADRLDISLNESFNGTVWSRDNTGHNGHLIVFSNTGFDYYRDTGSGLFRKYIITSEGRVQERGRNLVQGEWNQVSYSSSNFSHSAGSSNWVVESGDLYCYAYSIIGSTMFIHFGCFQTTISVAGTPYLKIPGGYTALQQIHGPIALYSGGAWEHGWFTTNAGSEWIQFYRTGFNTFPVVTNNIWIISQMIIPLSSGVV